MKRFTALTLVAALVGVAWLTADAPKPSSDAGLEQLLKKASAGGKYRMLIAQIKVDNEKDVGDFKDLGQQSRTEYAGYKNLPKGYWVYAKPYWFIWRDLSSVAEKRQKRAWG